MKGILFKPDMIQAIIEGRKTQTRRVIKPQLEDYRDSYPDGYDCPPACMVKYKGNWIDDGDFINDYARYQVGETVYVKEAYCFPITMDNLSPSEIYYKYGAFQRRYLLDGIVRGKNPFSLTMIDGRVRSPMMMPEWAARYFITITDVRAERLGNMISGDCLAEGITASDEDGIGQQGIKLDYKFRQLWNSINKDYPWELNPWVFVYAFKQEMK